MSFLDSNLDDNTSRVRDGADTYVPMQQRARGVAHSAPYKEPKTGRRTELSMQKRGLIL